jgi:hypothetical protein
MNQERQVLPLGHSGVNNTWPGVQLRGISTIGWGPQQDFKFRPLQVNLKNIWRPEHHQVCREGMKSPFLTPNLPAKSVVSPRERCCRKLIHHNPPMRDSRKVNCLCGIILSRELALAGI